MTSRDYLVFFLELLVLLAASRALGEVFRWLRQPVVVGELLAGIAVGPSLLGALAPRLYAELFPAPPGGLLPPGLDLFTMLGVTLLMLVAGLEMDLPLIRRHARLTVWCAVCGSVIPLVFGIASAYLLEGLWDIPSGRPRLLFAFVLGISLALSALPVIAKTLLDLGIYRTRVGAVILSAAMIDDLGVWILFSLAVALVPGAGREGAAPSELASPWRTALLTAALLLLSLSAGRWAVNRSLPWIQRRLSWPGGLVGATVAAGLAMGVLAIWIGVHPVFGSLLAGVAIGSSPNLRPGSKEVIYQFVMSVFAPIFFASIGLRMDLRHDLDLALAAWVFLLGCLGKLLGAGAGARLGGLGWRESSAVAVGLNSRGIMGIVLGLVALEEGAIGRRMFVALAALGIGTSLISGPLLRLILGAGYAERESEAAAGPSGQDAPARAETV